MPPSNIIVFGNKNMEKLIKNIKTYYFSMAEKKKLKIKNYDNKCNLSIKLLFPVCNNKNHNERTCNATKL